LWKRKVFYSEQVIRIFGEGSGSLIDLLSMPQFTSVQPHILKYQPSTDLFYSMLLREMEGWVKGKHTNTLFCLVQSPSVFLREIIWKMENLLVIKEKPISIGILKNQTKGIAHSYNIF